ncbi:MAG: hypothetical protein J6C17_03610 [Clostridia bacterium]|nr:hypothetical protein [Clostridia bacterium]
MTLKDLTAGGCTLVLILLTLIQVTPVKINPWSALARCIGRALNQEMHNSLNSLSDEFIAFKTEVSRNFAVQCRARILRFGDEILHDKQHTKEHFDQILTDITCYENYCRQNPHFENNITALTSKRIKDIYTKCLSENIFL